MDAKQWFLYVVDHHEGPFSAEEIKKMVEKGEVPPTSFIWKDGYADWVMMSDATEFGGGGPGTDGHGPVSFATPTQRGPDLGGVGPGDSVWCLQSKKIFSGPFSQKVIVRKINEGSVSPTDSVWKEGWSSFVQIAQIPEFMSGVNTKGSEKQKKMSSAASAMGLGGASSKSYKWYKSSKFFSFVGLILLATCYQGAVTGSADGLLEVLNLKDKVKAANLPPIPFGMLGESVSTIGSSVSPYFGMALEKIEGILPEQLQGFIGQLALPEGISEPDRLKLKTAASFPKDQGVSVAAAVPVGDELTPSFVLAGNLPDATTLTVVLKGKPETLLNAFGFEKTFTVTIAKKTAQTPHFTTDGNKPLPKGEYQLSILQNSKSIATENFFLGGKKDATYDTRLKEYHDRVRQKSDQETNELRQIVSTVSSMANESHTKFLGLVKPPVNAVKKKQWSEYDSKFRALSSQIMGMIPAITPETKNNWFYPHLYDSAKQLLETAARLHDSENVLMQKAATQADVDSTNNLMQEVARLTHDLEAHISNAKPGQ